MDTLLRSPSGLYPKLLGDAWWGLGDAIRHFHGSGGPVRAVGAFVVRRGSNRVARALARLARLPEAGEGVAVRLQVTARGESEEWHRTFAGRPLVSLQFGRPGGLLVERVGAVELRFRLEVVGGALSYRAVRAALCLGPLRVPLPSWLSPRVTARESPGTAGGRIDVSVDVTLPLVGRLVAYRGELTRVEVPG